MLWARFDCQSPSHPKLVRAGAEAAWFWHASICYSNLHELDGRIAKDLLPLLYHPLARKASQIAARLCELNLWHDRGDHYEIHDYEVFQAEAMKAEMESKREARREYERERKQSQRNDIDDVRKFVPDNVPDNDVEYSGTSQSSIPGLSSRAHVPTPEGACRPVVSDLVSASQTSKQKAAAEMWAVFERWKTVWGKGPRTEFDVTRQRCVRKALSAYPFQDVIDAIDGAHMDPFLLGENRDRKVYDSITLHLRDAEHIEKNRDRKRGSGPVAAIAAPYHNRLTGDA